MNPKFSPMRRTVRLTLQLLLLVGFVLITVWAAAQTAPTLISDQPDYAPGTTATLIGSGFRPGESVTLQVLHYDGTSDGGADHQPWAITADSSGNFVTAWHVCEDDCVGSTLRATADGQTSSLHAQVVFTDASKCGTPTVSAPSPSSQSVCSGSNVSILVTATSQVAGGTLTYKWKVNNQVLSNGPTGNGSTISGATTSTLTISNAQTADANTKYNVDVTENDNTNPACTPQTINSGFAVLAVNAPPSISTQPVSTQTVCTGTAVSFSVSAIGTGLTYQWRKGTTNLSNGGSISGAATSTLTINPVAAADAASNYNVVVSGTAPCAPVASANAALVVNTPPDIIATPASQTICSGNSFSIGLSSSGSGTSFAWTYSLQSNLSLSPNDGGGSGSTISYTAANSNNGLARTATFNITATNSGCSTVGTATVVVNAPPTFPNGSGPVNTTVNAGTSTTFSVTAQGTNETYQWQVDIGSGFVNLSNDATYSGVATNTLAIANTPFSLNGYKYRCIVSVLNCSSATSNSATLTVIIPCTAPLLSAVGTDVTCTGANNGSINLTTSGGSPTPFTYLWSNGATTEDVSGLAPGNYSVTVTSASGGCSSSISQTIGTVVDVTKPVISGVPANIIINSNDASTTTCTQIAAWTPPTATDNCSLVSFASDYSSGDAFAVGTTTVTYTATDASGNVQTASFTVTVNDNTRPLISVTPITVNTNSGCSATGVLLGTPVTSDNCAVATVTNDAPSVFPLGSTLVTWAVSDSHGNSASTTQLVTVTDVESPVFKNISEDIVLSSCTPTATWSVPIATDNCSVVVTQTAGPSSGSIFANGSTTIITYVAMDGSGNSSSASFTVTRLATLAATASGINVSCYGGNNGSASVSVSGGRSPYSYSWSNGGSTSSISGLVAGVYSVTVTDADGCTVSSSYSVTQPTALTSSASATTILCNGGSATVTISANGGTVPYSGTGSFTRAAGSWTFTVTDANGCTSTSTVTITEPSLLTATIATNNSYLYFGYSGDQSATITAKPSGGTAPYSVAITMVNGDGSKIRTAGKLICDYINNSGDEVWTTGSNTLSTVTGCGVEPTSTSKNNITAGGSYSVNVMLLDDARFIATVTDANGCTYTIPYISAARVDAEDVRCFAGNTSVQKVTMCHRTGNAKNPCVTICIDESAVNDHLAHGDFFGPCNNTCTAPAANARVTNDNGGANAQPLEVDTYPNPFRSSLSVKVINPDNAEVTMNMIDVTGRSVDVRIQSKSDDNVYTLETDKIGGGFYILRINIGSVSKVIKVMKE